MYFTTTTNTINTAFLIVFFDEFVLKIQKPTVVVLDNAKIHQSKAFKIRCKYWQTRGLFFVYSPHLNRAAFRIIEKCWHELKQRWISVEDYYSFETLAYAVQLTLMAVGTELFINFSPFDPNDK